MPMVVMADVPGADVIAPDHEDVGFLLLCFSSRCTDQRCNHCSEQG